MKKRLKLSGLLCLVVVKRGCILKQQLKIKKNIEWVSGSVIERKVKRERWMRF